MVEAVEVEFHASAVVAATLVDVTQRQKVLSHAVGHSVDPGCDQIASVAELLYRTQPCPMNVKGPGQDPRNRGSLDSEGHLHRSHHFDDQSLPTHQLLPYRLCRLPEQEEEQLSARGTSDDRAHANRHTAEDLVAWQAMENCGSKDVPVHQSR